jgi:hypothetical protein
MMPSDGTESMAEQVILLCAFAALDIVSTVFENLMYKRLDVHLGLTPTIWLMELCSMMMS